MRLKTIQLHRTVVIFSLIVFGGHSRASIQQRSLAIYQAQQSSYKRQDWAHFFGRAQIYRKGVLKNVTSISETKLFDDLVTLELLALGRHCQRSAIQELAQWVKKIEREKGAEAPGFHLALASIEAAEGMGRPIKEPAQDPAAVKVWWPESPQQFWSYENRNKVVTKVENLCD